MGCNLLQLLWKSFLRLNLFKSHSSNAQTIVWEQLATRVYIISMISLLFLIAIVSACIVRTENVIEYSPSYVKFIDLWKKYSNTLKCPCSKIGVAYGTFVKTHVDFHQVCSSHFVTQDWIDSIFIPKPTSFPTVFDICFYLSHFWQVIAGLCSVSKNTWTDAISSFGLSHFLSPIAIPDEVVRNQVQEALNNQLSLAQASLVRTLHAIQRITSENQFVSGLSTNFYLRYPPLNYGNWTYPKMFPVVFDDCSCLNMTGCPRPAFIKISQNRSVSIPGMIIDCYIVDSTLASTLECYYNSTCFKLLHQQLTTTVNLLSNSSNRHFLFNSTVQTLLDNSMIDQWYTEIKFNLFYSECDPTYCTYSYMHRFSILFIITTTVGAFGTLSLILRLIAPFIAQAFIRWTTRISEKDNILENVVISRRHLLPVMMNHIRRLPHIISQKLIKLNLFESETSRTEANVKHEILSTRLFIITLVMCSIIIGFYIFLSEQNQMMTIMHPSLETYEKLYAEYSTSIQCPCANFSIPHEAFLNVTFVLHQVCSSDLVSSNWLNYLLLFDPNDVPIWTETDFSRDFRSIGLWYFQLLATFCSLAQANIADGQRIFKNSLFIENNLLPQSLFIQETKTLANAFINKTRNIYVRTLKWVDIAGIINRFLTATNVNYQITVTNDNQVNINDVQIIGKASITHTSAGSSDPCSCARDIHECVLRPILYTNGSSVFDFVQVFYEIRIGCMPSIGFSMSEIVWWYNKTYMENIRATYAIVINNSQLSPQLESLNSSLPTNIRKLKIMDFFILI
ncbi:unnamed protein product [Rotaria sp. Silwood1]|nr:unnamed protein product [Rotaria sp. Silwood1]CAF1427352.1 unnamed protein product [Rotaria sp. Silwood1]